MTINLYNKLTLVPLVLAGILLNGCNAESAPSGWQQTTAGKAGSYRATLNCTTAPQPGRFQECQIAFTDRQNQAAGIVSVQLEGGMPGHGHGLPTSPTLTLQDSGSYRIDGLKYNMPGRWLLGFQVNGESGEDRLIFDFMI